jgi:proteic killer suppression protein
MIASFSCRDTAALFNHERVPRFVNIERVALRKLVQLHIARTVSDLRIPPSNRLERLSGDRAGHYSIRINDPWRLCFVFDDGLATDVAIVDYH